MDSKNIISETENNSEVKVFTLKFTIDADEALAKLATIKNELEQILLLQTEIQKVGTDK